MTRAVCATTEPDEGVEDLTTSNTTTGFVTDDVHAEAVQAPWVIVAVLVTLVVSLEATLASTLTLAESPAARSTVIVRAEPVTETVQVPPVATVEHAGVPVRVTFVGKGSETVAVPDAVPVLVTRIA